MVTYLLKIITKSTSGQINEVKKNYTQYNMNKIKVYDDLNSRYLNKAIKIISHEKKSKSTMISSCNICPVINVVPVYLLLHLKEIA